MTVYNTISMIIAILSLAASAIGLIITKNVKAAVEDTKKDIYMRLKRENYNIRFSQINEECTPDNARNLLLIMDEIIIDVNFSQEEKDQIAQRHVELKKVYNNILSGYSMFQDQNDLAYISAYSAVSTILFTIHE